MKKQRTIETDLVSHLEEFARRSNRLIWMCFYWIGAILTLTCVALIFGGHTVTGARLESLPLPSSWQCGCGAMLAFLAAEVCQPDSIDRNKAQEAVAGKFDVW